MLLSRVLPAPCWSFGLRVSGAVAPSAPVSTGFSQQDQFQITAIPMDWQAQNVALEQIFVATVSTCLPGPEKRPLLFLRQSDNAIANTG
jgi:hypothetical protein